MPNWGATGQERSVALPCDGLAADAAAIRADRAISIAAPRSTVFGWPCQLRVAPYSYDLLDHFGRRSPRTRDPALSRLEVGQRFMRLFELRSFIDGEHITLNAQTRAPSPTPCTLRATGRGRTCGCCSADHESSDVHSHWARS